MKEASFSFVAPMVRALRRPVHPKLQTRRLFIPNRKPYAVGQKVWIREAWRAEVDFDHLPPSEIPRGRPILYAADGTDASTWGKLRPGMFMCRWMSRLSTTITEVRLQHLQVIRGEDAIAEGVGHFCSDDGDVDWWFGVDERIAYPSPENAYRDLWDSINGEDGAASWSADPLVYAYTFEPVVYAVDRAPRDEAIAA